MDSRELSPSFHMILLLLLVSLLGASSAASAQTFRRPLTSLPESEESLKREIQRIESMDLPDADNAYAELKEINERLQSLGAASIPQDPEARLTQSKSELDAALKELDATKTRCENNQLAEVEEHMERLAAAIGEFYKIPNVDWDELVDERFVQELADASAVCAIAVKRGDWPSSTHAKVSTWFEGQADVLRARYQVEKFQAERSGPAIVEAWSKRAASIRKIREQASSGARASIADRLQYLILILGGFSLAIIVAIRLFDPAIQAEWVGSGQVIQFATVMVLLIVIMGLGLSGILEDNSLSALLGGVAGYVLSQGVGTAAARQATKSMRPGPQQQSGQGHDRV